jgi:hypothetical protein
LRHARLTLLAFVTLSTICVACSLVEGHFHQVTAIHGRIVGKDLGLLRFRWLRQSFRVNDATLTLYEYRSSAKLEDLRRLPSSKQIPMATSTLAKYQKVTILSTSASRVLIGWVVGSMSK